MQVTPKQTSRDRAVVGRISRRVKELSRDLEKNRDRVKELVNLANALLLPRAWMGLDDYLEIHVTVLHREYGRALERRFENIPVELGFTADHIWSFTPHDGKFRCVKSRFYETGTVYECDNGPPGVIG